MLKDTSFALYTDRNAKPIDYRPGLVVNVMVSPPDLKDEPIKLIVISDANRVREHLDMAMIIANIYPYGMPNDAAFEQYGLKAISIDDVSPEEQLFWETEIQRKRESCYPASAIKEIL